MAVVAWFLLTGTAMVMLAITRRRLRSPAKPKPPRPDLPYPFGDG
jgi:hypothetical protein